MTVTTDFDLPSAPVSVVRLSFQPLARALLTSLLIAVLRLAMRCSHSVSNALRVRWGTFTAVVGGFDEHHGGLAVHDHNALGLLDAPFEFGLELFPQFNSAERAIGIDVAEVVWRRACAPVRADGCW